jgi:hypothetical protein
MKHIEYDDTFLKSLEMLLTMIRLVIDCIVLIKLKCDISTVSQCHVGEPSKILCGVQ